MAGWVACSVALNIIDNVGLKVLMVVNANEKMGRRLGYLRDLKFGKIHGTKKNCADALGISTGYWGDIERGRKKLGIDMIQRLADFFGADCEWLVTGKNYDCKFLVDYYLRDVYEESLWYDSLARFTELAVRWRKEKNNKFFKAAAVTYSCKKNPAVWAELEELYADHTASDVLIEKLVVIDGGGSARNKSGRFIKGIIAEAEKVLLELEPNAYSELPSVIPTVTEGNDLDSDAIVRLLEDKVASLEKDNSKLKEQLRKEKVKVTKLKKKMA